MADKIECKSASGCYVLPLSAATCLSLFSSQVSIHCCWWRRMVTVIDTNTDNHVTQLLCTFPLPLSLLLIHKCLFGSFCVYQSTTCTILRRGKFVWILYYRTPEDSSIWPNFEKGSSIGRFKKQFSQKVKKSDIFCEIDIPVLQFDQNLPKIRGQPKMILEKMS